MRIISLMHGTKGKVKFSECNPTVRVNPNSNRRSMQ